MTALKRYLLPILALALILSFSSCKKDNSNADDKSGLGVYETAEKIVADMGFLPDDISVIYHMSAEPDSDAEYNDFKFLSDFGAGEGVDYTRDLFDDFAFIRYFKLLPVSFELAIFKVKQKDGKTDEELVAAVEEMCRGRVMTVKGDLHDYVPEHAHYAENVKVKIKGDYVYYVISENPDKIYTIIDENLK